MYKFNYKFYKGKHLFTCIFREPVYNEPLELHLSLLKVIQFDSIQQIEHIQYRLDAIFTDASGKMLPYNNFLGYFFELQDMIIYLSQINALAFYNSKARKVMEIKDTTDNLVQGLKISVIKEFGV